MLNEAFSDPITSNIPILNYKKYGWLQRSKALSMGSCGFYSKGYVRIEDISLRLHLRAALYCFLCISPAGVPGHW